MAVNVLGHGHGGSNETWGIHWGHLRASLRIGHSSYVEDTGSQGSRPSLDRIIKYTLHTRFLAHCPLHTVRFLP